MTACRLQVWPILVGVLCAAFPCFCRELDKRCLQGDCVVLAEQAGGVFAWRTGEFAGKRRVGDFDRAGVPYIPAAEAPLRVKHLNNGWTAVVSAFLPHEFDFDAPALHIYLLDARRTVHVVSEQYNFLSSFNAGGILGGDDDFVQISSTGSHAYVVRTVAWWLPPRGGPKIVMDVPGLLKAIEKTAAENRGGFLVDIQTYDGEHSETKGWRSEFWRWNPATMLFSKSER